MLYMAWKRGSKLVSKTPSSDGHQIDTSDAVSICYGESATMGEIEGSKRLCLYRPRPKRTI